MMLMFVVVASFFRVVVNSDDKEEEEEEDDDDDDDEDDDLPLSALGQPKKRTKKQTMASLKQKAKQLPKKKQQLLGKRRLRRSQTEPRIILTSERYEQEMANFMTWRNKPKKRYKKTERFSKEELQQLKPQEIVRYFKLKAYGREDAKDNDRPLHGRANSITQYKKCIFHFHPDDRDWYVIPDTNKGIGNPTKEKSVRKLIRILRMMERNVSYIYVLPFLLFSFCFLFSHFLLVDPSFLYFCQGNGKKSQARNPFTIPEFCTIMKLIERCEDPALRLFLLAYFRYQLHLGARLDDVAKLRQDNIFISTDEAIASASLFTRLCWSKNIRDERQSK